MRIEFSPSCDGDSYALIVSKMAGCQVVVTTKTLKPRQKHVYDYDHIDGVVMGAGTDGVTITLTDANGEVEHGPSGNAVRRRYLWENVEAVTYQ